MTKAKYNKTNMNSQSGIWQFANRLKPYVETKFRLTINEGNTEVQAIDGIYLKREDQNPTGSVKDRGLAYQISALVQQGHKKFTISSSGNAAISAAAYCELAVAELTVFVSPKIKTNKLKKLKVYKNINIKRSLRAISESTLFAKENNYYNLRPSKDPLGSVGYQTVAYELQKQLPETQAIFFPVSSATTLVGIGEGYKNNLPQLHAVQTTKINPLASEFNKNFIETETSLADALVAKTMPRKKQALNLIKQSNGSGWIVSDKQIKEAHNWLKKRKIKTSYEGAAALAGYFKAKKSNWNFQGPVVILLTGNIL